MILTRLNLLWAVSALCLGSTLAVRTAADLIFAYEQDLDAV